MYQSQQYMTRQDKELFLLTATLLTILVVFESQYFTQATMLRLQIHGTIQGSTRLSLMLTIQKLLQLQLILKSAWNQEGQATLSLYTTEKRTTTKELVIRDATLQGMTNQQEVGLQQTDSLTDRSRVQAIQQLISTLENLFEANSTRCTFSTKTIPTEI